MSGVQRAINVELSPTLPRSKLALFFANLDELMEEDYSRKIFRAEIWLRARSPKVLPARATARKAAMKCESARPLYSSMRMYGESSGTSARPQ